MQYLFDTTPRAAEEEESAAIGAVSDGTLTPPTSADAGRPSVEPSVEATASQVSNTVSNTVSHIQTTPVSRPITSPGGDVSPAVPGRGHYGAMTPPSTTGGASPRLQGPPAGLPGLPAASEGDQQYQYPMMPPPASVPESIRSDVNPLFNTQGDSTLIADSSAIHVDGTAAQAGGSTQHSPGLSAAAAIALEFAQAPSDPGIAARLQEALSRTTAYKPDVEAGSGGVGRLRVVAGDTPTSRAPRGSVAGGRHVYTVTARSTGLRKGASGVGRAAPGRGPHSSASGGKSSKLVSLHKLQKADLVVDKMAELAQRMPSMNSVGETEQLDCSQPVPQTPAESQPGASSQIECMMSSHKAGGRGPVSLFGQREGGESSERVGVCLLHFCCIHCAVALAVGVALVGGDVRLECEFTCMVFCRRSRRSAGCCRSGLRTATPPWRSRARSHSCALCASRARPPTAASLGTAEPLTWHPTSETSPSCRTSPSPTAACMSTASARSRARCTLCHTARRPSTCCRRPAAPPRPRPVTAPRR